MLHTPWLNALFIVELCLVSQDPGLYSFINQGVLTVDGIDDVVEMKITDVCWTINWLSPTIKLVFSDTNRL